MAKRQLLQGWRRVLANGAGGIAPELVAGTAKALVGIGSATAALTRTVLLNGWLQAGRQAPSIPLVTSQHGSLRPASVHQRKLTEPLTARRCSHSIFMRCRSAVSHVTDELLGGPAVLVLVVAMALLHVHMPVVVHSDVLSGVRVLPNTVRSNHGVGLIRCQAIHLSARRHRVLLAGHVRRDQARGQPALVDNVKSILEPWRHSRLLRLLHLQLLVVIRDHLAELLQLVDLLLLSDGLQLYLLFLCLEADDLLLVVLEGLLALKQLLVLPLPVLDLLLYLLIEAVDHQLLLGLLFVECFCALLRLSLEVMAQVFLDFGILVLVLVVRSDQHLDVAVDLVVFLVEAHISLNQSAHVLRAQLRLAGRDLCALPSHLHALPLLLDLLVLIGHFSKLILRSNDLQLQRLPSLLQRLNLLITLLLLLQIVLLQHLETVLVVLRRLLDLAPLILHALDLATKSLDLLLEVLNALLPLRLLLLLLVHLVLQFAPHGVLLGEDLLQLVFFEADGGDLLVGAVDVLGEGIFTLEGGGVGLLELGVELLDGFGLCLDLADEVLDAELDGGLGEVWDSQGDGGVGGLVQVQVLGEIDSGGEVVVYGVICVVGRLVWAESLEVRRV